MLTACKDVRRVSDAVEGEGRAYTHRYICEQRRRDALVVWIHFRNHRRPHSGLRQQTTHHTMNQPPRSIHLGESREYHVILLSNDVIIDR